jgi:hypothetical protein
VHELSDHALLGLVQLEVALPSLEVVVEHLVLAQRAQRFESGTAATTAAAPAATTAAAGWVASTPAWPAHGLPRSTGITDFNNVTSMPYAGVSGGYG